MQFYLRTLIEIVAFFVAGALDANGKLQKEYMQYSYQIIKEDNKSSTNYENADKAKKTIKFSATSTLFYYLSRKRI